MYPTVSDQIRPTFLRPLLRSAFGEGEYRNAVKKSAGKCHLFNFLKFSKTFFHMDKLQIGKETLNFLPPRSAAVPGRSNPHPHRVRPTRLISPTKSDQIRPSQAQSSLVKPSQRPLPPPVKKSVKKRESFWLFLTINMTSTRQLLTLPVPLVTCVTHATHVTSLTFSDVSRRDFPLWIHLGAH